MRPNGRWGGFGFRAAAGALAAGALLTAGCGNNPYPPGESAGPVLYRALGEDPKTLDPSVAYVVTESEICDVIYPSFFQYHYLKRDPYVLELALGAEEPRREPYAFTVNENGRSVRKRGEAWTFRIKPGLRFQDDPCFPGGKGREIRAADFLYSFRRMGDPAVSCPIRGFFENRILGYAEYLAGNQERAKRKLPADLDAPVAGLRLDPKDPHHTFRILLNEPYPQLRFLMAMHFTAPIPREAVARYGTEFARHPVGAGPYVLAEWVPKRRIVLKTNPNRNPEFYPTEGAPGDREAGLLRDAGKRLPLADTIVYTSARESVVAWNLFLQGYLDGAAITQDNYQSAISRPGQLSPGMARRGVTLRRQAQPNIGYLSFNMEDPVVGGASPRNRKLRQAISLALDVDELIDLYYQGNAQPAQSLIPPGLFGYDPAYRNPYRRHDLARAKRLLAEAGYPGGISARTGERLTLYHDNYATTAALRQKVAIIERQIKALGVHVESRSYRFPVWGDRRNQGQFQFITYGWLADYPDPENFVFLLYGPNRRPGPNYAAYKNPEYDRVFERMRVLDDGPERLALIRRLREIAAEDCAMIPMLHEQSLSLSHDWLRNVKPHGVAYDVMKYRAVDGARRAERQAAWNRPVYWPTVALAGLVVVGMAPAAATVRRRRERHVRKPGSPAAASDGDGAAGRP